MNTMESILKQDSNVGLLLKWSSLFIFALLCLTVVKSFHDKYINELNAESSVLLEKSSLVMEMHNEMLSITRTQYQILHASSQQEVRTLLLSLSEQVSSYLLNFHKLEQVTDETDENLLFQFRNGFTQWHQFNQDLVGYANVVADSGFINTLNMIDVALSQFEVNSEEALLLIAELEQNNQEEQTLSN